MFRAETLANFRESATQSSRPRNPQSLKSPRPFVSQSLAVILRRSDSTTRAAILASGLLLAAAPAVAQAPPAAQVTTISVSI